MEENKQYKEADCKPGMVEDFILEINWENILHQIIKIRKKLYKAAIAGLVIGSIIAFSIPKQYTASVILSPEVGNGQSRTGGLASMAASFLGGSGDSDGTDALNASLAPEIVASTPFLLELFDARVINQGKRIDTTFVAYLENEKSPWWSHILQAPNMAINSIKSLFDHEEKKEVQISKYKTGTIELNTKDAQRLNSLRQLITIKVNKKTDMITLSVTLQDPQIAAIVADSVVSKLQQYITTYRTRKAKEVCKYLEMLYKEHQQEYYKAQQQYAHYVDANSNMVFQSSMAERERLQNDMNLAFQVYSQVAQQLQIARAKVQKEKPIFAVVEPAVVPLAPSGRSRKVVILGITLLTIVGVGLWELTGKKFYRNLKTKLKIYSA